MSTRLLSEAMIKKHYPHIRYVRIHTAGKNGAVIYAWNENLELPEKDVRLLKRFAAGYLPPYVCYQIKAYRAIQADGVPEAPDLPESIVQAAMDRSLNLDRIEALVNGMISQGYVSFDRYDENTGTIHFQASLEADVTGIERELIRQYLSEVIPIGSRFDVAYR